MNPINLVSEIREALAKATPTLTHADWLEQLCSTVESLLAINTELHNTMVSLSEEAADAQVERDKVIAALEWYADGDHYTNYGMGVEIWEDKGEIARTTLSSLKETQP